MADVVSVARYILDNVQETTAMKLHKLIYYCQAWHLAWTEHPLFKEKIEAWRNGPTIPTLFTLQKGHFKLKKGFFDELSENSASLSSEERDTIDRVLEFYASKDPHWLTQLTHLEAPWKNAREKNAREKNASASAKHLDHDHTAEEITHQSMFEYYSSLSNHV